ncbi:hypothetical protein NQ317_012158 [Molorchus minor]|uniref:MSP domain-containing protein n=1 Tax=Molorchus minor TaxID=1323400 RepID=A0ABQ9K4A9_9CUCU|nr:hypothetical protein NQ317_012158 [Molorchus minor]
MDPLPLIPTVEVTQNVVTSLRESFQSTIDGSAFPKDVAKNFIQNKVDENLKLKENAQNVIGIYENLNDRLLRINTAGREVIDQQAHYFVAKDEIEQIICLQERLKLKHCHLFRDLNTDNVEYFNLLQKKHLLPDAIRQFLDYRLNEGLHLCESCISILKMELGKEVRRATCIGDFKKSDESINIVNNISQSKELHESIGVKIVYRDGVKVFQEYNRQRKPKDKDKSVERKKSNIQPVFKVMSSEVIFHNYKVGQTYKRTITVINTSPTLQQLFLTKSPKHSCLSIQPNKTSKIAPGMSVKITVTFKPEIYLNRNDEVVFRNPKGDTVKLSLSVTRDIPKLIVCIFKSNSCLFERVKPGTKKFKEARRKALNYTIDCGSCLVGEYINLTVFVQNKGADGRFFIITEDEWIFQDIKNVSALLELSTESFWIFPAFFQLSTDDMIELTILFHPIQSGLGVEKCYMICDNNSFEQIEILGDSLEFTKKYIQINVPPNDTDITALKDYCIFLGSVNHNSSITVTITIRNNSPLFINSNWTFRHHHDKRFVFAIDKTWVVYKFGLVKLFGSRVLIFSFIILDIPMISLSKDEEFLIVEKEELTGNILTKCVDIRIIEIEVACFVTILDDKELLQENMGFRLDPCGVQISIRIIVGAYTTMLTTCPPKEPRQPKLRFSCPFLEFGILPNGVNVEKNIVINNLNKGPIDWRIVEIKYNIDNVPHVEILEEKNISCTFGTFSTENEKKEIAYRIIDKDIGRWVSILFLVSTDEDNVIEPEAICIVVYEIINFDIVIDTGHTKYPILCPLKLMHVGVPTTLTFTVENFSPITGCFCFSKTYGADLERIKLVISPRGGVLKPMQTKEITVTMTCNDVGIFENAFLSCFIGPTQEPIVLRILCAVDGFHAYFYLPETPDSYRKIMWPPKVVYEYDDDWMICPCTMF